MKTKANDKARSGKCLYKAILLCVILFASISAFAQTHYVAVNGSDSSGNGSSQNPWATISYAIDNVADGATILVGAGTYNGQVRLDQQFTNGIDIRSEPLYQARLRHNNGAAVICFTCQGVTLEGFDIAHSANNNRGLVIQIQTSDARDVVLRNNIIHDSSDNDLLKINNGTRDILVQGNLFYNQAGSDEHIDINSVENVTVIDNIFFNSASQSVTSSFVLVKDSNGNSDGVVGSKDIDIRRNIFFNWQGNDGQSFVRIGEDNTPTFEAENVLIENNLMLGNSSRMMRSAFTVGGSKDIVFQFNTVVGDLPSRSFNRLVQGGIANENITMRNNLWSDPSGTMGTEGFIGADVFEALSGANTSVILDNNAYYNGGNAIPADTSQQVNIADDLNAKIGNPLLPSQNGLVLPTYNGTNFGGGFSTIREVFTDFANRYGRPGPGSVVIDQASVANLPSDDLLGSPRGSNADIGAIEVDAEPPIDPAPPRTGSVILTWLMLLLD